MRRAFTLIELLVVIAIIAILAAILFPVFAQAKAAGKKAACVSNLHQLGLAVATYMSDHEGTFPMLCVGDYPKFTGWATSILPYGSKGDVMLCPADPSDYRFGNPSWLATGYWLNGNVNYQPGDLGHPIFPRTESDLTASAQTILAGDGRKEAGADFYNECGNGNQGGPASTAACDPRKDLYPESLVYVDFARRHGEGSNYLLADTHVKWVHGDSDVKPSGIMGPRVKPENANGRPTFSL